MRKTVEQLIRKNARRQTNGCLLWIGRTNSYGYGMIAHKGVTYMAHRFVYEARVGPIPDGLTLDHFRPKCPKNCVEPSHLEPVTLVENVMRGSSPQAKNARKTHCPRGHPYSPDNTACYRNGRWRVCKACRNLRYLLRKTDAVP